MAEFIRYTEKGNGTYACIINAVRRDGVKMNEYVGNLGRVIDREKGIFRSRERGLFRYTREEGYTALPVGDDPAIQGGLKERLILDFGGTYVLEEYMKSCGLYDIVESLLPGEEDTLLSLLYFRCETDAKAYMYAGMWHEGDYASVIHPGAKLQGQRISELLSRLGSEAVMRDFFTKYIAFLYRDREKGEKVGVIIDSTGLHNATDMPMTAVSNHNGDINRESRFIIVQDKATAAPVFFRAVPGNVLDMSTLCRTVTELGQLGVDIDCALVDAGYYDEENAKALYGSHIHFISRLGENRRLYKELVSKHIGTIRQAKYMVRYGGRIVYMRRFAVDLFGNPGFAYLGVDMDVRMNLEKRTSINALADKLPSRDIDDSLRRLGAFALVSSTRLETSEILPSYYIRQRAEQLIDVAKNNADIVPLRIHSESTYQGHLLLSFMATAVISRLQREFLGKTKKEQNINPEGSFMALMNQKCKVYGDVVIPQEPVKRVNEILDTLDLEFPVAIDLGKPQTETAGGKPCGKK